MDREVLTRWLAEGLSLEEIGRRAGLHASTVGYWIDRHGLTAAHAERHAARGSLDREELETLVGRDLTVREIAAAVGRSPTTVRYWLRRYELTTTVAARRQRGEHEGPERTMGHCERHGVTPFVPSPGRKGRCVRCRADAVSRWRRQAKRILVEEAGGACRLCGYARCVAALEFHHVDPATKRFSIGSRGLARSIHVLREEAAKCMLVCANCHAELEAGVRELA